MIKPAYISWFVEDKPLAMSSYIGNFEATDLFCIQLTAINNYLGSEPSEALDNPSLIIHFKNLEDSFFLNYLYVTFDGVHTTKFEVIDTRATAKIPRAILGDYQNTPASCTLEIKLFMTQKLHAKPDLKELFIDIV